MKEHDLISWARRGVSALRLCSWAQLGLGAACFSSALVEGPTHGLLRGSLICVALGLFGLNRTNAWKRWLESAA